MEYSVLVINPVWVTLVILIKTDTRFFIFLTNIEHFQVI